MLALDKPAHIPPDVHGSHEYRLLRVGRVLPGGLGHGAQEPLRRIGIKRKERASEEHRGPRPAIAKGLPLAAYSDDQLDEMATWVRSDGVERTDLETAEELREALGITRRGFQSDAVLGNVVRRTKLASNAADAADADDDEGYGDE